jgi:hypothetical protein
MRTRSVGCEQFVRLHRSLRYSVGFIVILLVLCYPGRCDANTNNNPRQPSQHGHPHHQHIHNMHHRIPHVNMIEDGVASESDVVLSNSTVSVESKYGCASNSTSSLPMWSWGFARTCCHVYPYKLVLKRSYTSVLLFDASAACCAVSPV